MSPGALRISKSQKDEMVTFMERNPNLWKCKFSKNFTRKIAKNMWKRLTTRLNSMIGVQKDYKSWRKSWLDLKSTAKVKAAKMKRNGTESSLSGIEARIIALIGTTAVEGHQDINESPVLFNFQAACNNTESYVVEEQNVLIRNEDHTQPPNASTMTNFNNGNYSLGSPGSKEADGSRSSITAHRFEHTISAAEKLLAAFENKIESKQEYYDKKLKLLETDLKIKDRMTEALATIISPKIQSN